MKGKEAVLFRVQDHLRKMGLARKALRKMIHEQDVCAFCDKRLKEYLAARSRPPSDSDLQQEIQKALQSRQAQDQGPACPEVVSELTEMANAKNRARFAQLFRSVGLEPKVKGFVATA